MFAEERIKNIVDYIQAHDRATIHELQKKFNVSLVTIRRDLTHIEKNFNIKRTHGGAIHYITEHNEFSFEKKYKQNLSVKNKIAAKVVELIEEGDSILLDGGSTNYEIALQTAALKDVKALANSERPYVLNGIGQS